jgi:hypothetical protein
LVDEQLAEEETTAPRSRLMIAVMKVKYLRAAILLGSDPRKQMTKKIRMK